MSKKRSKASRAQPGLRSEWRAWAEEKKPVALFTLKFGLLVLLLYVFLALPVGDRWLYRNLQVDAWLANGCLRLFGQHTQLVSDVVIQSPHFTMGIRRGCDGVEPSWLLCSAMLAFPASLRKKLLGVALAVVFLQLLNLVRILTLYWIGVNLPSLFNSAHLELWPTIFILVIIVFFLRWKETSLVQDPPVRA
jgi:exosortase family protein XrtM